MNKDEEDNDWFDEDEDEQRRINDECNDGLYNSLYTTGLID